jgi:hypothetical protein
MSHARTDITTIDVEVNFRMQPSRIKALGIANRRGAAG